jgi:hypothetical protein
MKRYALMAAALGLVLVAAWVVRGAPGSHRSSRGTTRQGHTHAGGNIPTLLAAWEYQHRLAHHWRDLMLQP